MTKTKEELKKERQEEMNLIFNMVASDYGEEIAPSVKNDKNILAYINGDISGEEMRNRVLNGLRKKYVEEDKKHV